MNPKMEIEISAHAKEVMQTKNGLVSVEDLKTAKKCLLVDSLLQYYTLVEHRSHYPVDNEADIDLSLDIVLLSKSRYLELKETEFNYLKLCN